MCTYDSTCKKFTRTHSTCRGFNVIPTKLKPCVTRSLNYLVNRLSINCCGMGSIKFDERSQIQTGERNWNKTTDISTIDDTTNPS